MKPNPIAPPDVVPDLPGPVDPDIPDLPGDDPDEPLLPDRPDESPPMQVSLALAGDEHMTPAMQRGHCGTFP